MTPWTRRSVLETGLGGAALLTMPRFLAGCAKSPAALVPPSGDNPLAAWFGLDESVLRQVLAELTARGGDHADLYFQYRRSNWIDLEDGIIGRAHSRIDLGVGLRVVVGDKTGYALTEDLSLESMMEAARTAAAIAQGTTPPAAPEVFRHRELSGHYTIGVPYALVGLEDKLPMLRRAESFAKAKDPSVDKVSISWSDDDERVLIADVRGNIVTDERPMSRLWVNTTATRNGQSLTNRSNLAGRRGLDWYTDERLAFVAGQAVDRTLVLFDARRPPAGELPVVLAAGASGILLHEAIGHGMEADFNRKDVSIYSDMLGQKVAPDFVTIVDDGTIPNERGTLNCDDEGTPCERTVLVENGVLNSYLHDSISARHYGVEPTGSGRRESFRHPPMPRMRCTFMEKGPHTKDEIIASVKHGIVAETFTNGEVQIGAGDYTFYIKNGWLIEDGRITAPIKDCNIIGNGPESLRNVTMAADDPTLDTGGWTCGKNGQSVPVSQGLPTVLVSKMTVGGSNAG